MDKFYFPMETMRITQGPFDDHSHHPHNIGDPKDYPIDSAGIDGNRSACFAPTDMVITAIRKGKENTNTVWLVSTNEVKTPTFIDKVFMVAGHWIENDEYMRYRNVGDVIKKGEVICFEGDDDAKGQNHLHIVVGRGYSDDWTINSVGAWVMTGDCKMPNEVMYIYDKFTTTIMETADLDWETTDTDYYEDIKYVGIPVERDTKKDQLNVKVQNLRARTDPSLNANILGYINMGIYNIEDKAEADGYTWYKVENMWIAYNEEWEDNGYTWYKVENMWIAYNEEWEDILPKEEPSKKEIQEEYKKRILDNIDKWLSSLIEE